MPSTGHTQAPRGKRVIVRLRNGEKFLDRFLRKENGFIYFFDHEKVPARHVKGLTIFKELNLGEKK
jgi:hypothetical protein